MKVWLRARGDFDEWREAARSALVHGILPREIQWNARGEIADLFESLEGLMPTGRRVDEAVTVPTAFVEMAQMMICHSDPGRFDLVYRLLWRLQRERQLLQMPTDPEVVQARAMVKAIGRDSHKMKAFVRFKEMPSETTRRRFIAWFEPEHFIVARTAGFFKRRFADMDWVIATPKGSAAWDGEVLRLSEDGAIDPALSDTTDDLWRTYFAHTFNPARLKVKMMQSEMPKKYWKNLPEAALIPELIRDAERRVRAMAEREASNTAPKFHESLMKRKSDQISPPATD